MMSSLALINEFLGQPANASEHGYQIDHILEFSHWFMGALFFGWSAFFVFVLIRFRRSRHPKADHAGVRSGISTHLEFSVVLIEAVLLLGFAIPLWAKRVNEFPPTQDAILVHVESPVELLTNHVNQNRVLGRWKFIHPLRPKWNGEPDQQHRLDQNDRKFEVGGNSAANTCMIGLRLAAP